MSDQSAASRQVTRSGDASRRCPDCGWRGPHTPLTEGWTECGAGGCGASWPPSPGTAPEEVVRAIAAALKAANRYPDKVPPLNDWQATVNTLTEADARAVIPAVVGLLRTQAQEWKSSDLMDAAAWLEGTL